MKLSEITSTIEDDPSVSKRSPVSVLLVAHAPEEAIRTDRCRLYDNFTVGRNAENDLTIEDGKISGTHLKITAQGEHFYLEDLGSTNGTYLDGGRLDGKTMLHHNAVIRVGQTVMIYHGDGEECLAPLAVERYGMVGDFHTASILKKVAEAAFSTEHLLITGPTGSGKELAAKAVHAMMAEGRQGLPYVTHNAACFTNDDEATATLLGIANRAFTSVNQRPGLIEQAEGGVLFLDEVHNYTTRVQRSLLRIIEDKQYSRIGETSTRAADVRFLFASNEPESIAPDLSGRLRRSLALPPLRERRADIPGIFDAVLRTKLESYGISEAEVKPLLKGRHYELLCLDGFEKYNVRGIKHLADIIATGIGTGTPPEQAVEALFSNRSPHVAAPNRSDSESVGLLSAPTSFARSEKDPVSESKYEKYKDIIIAQFNDRDRNISSTARALERRGLKVSRRHLRGYLRKWGVLS